MSYTIFLDQNIMYNTKKDFLLKHGFEQYYNKPASYHNSAIRSEITPPDGTKLIFFGCGLVGSDVIDVGVVVEPAQLFDPQSYNYSEAGSAKAVRNFFLYDSTTTYHPMGFSKTKNIKLGAWDIESLSDQHRVSFFTGNI